MKPIEELNISPWPWNTCTPTRKEVVVATLDSSRRLVEPALCRAENRMSDARLIAAAPELYEALAAMLYCAEKEAPYTDMSHMDIAMDMARKALAKAAGECGANERQ